MYSQSIKAELDTIARRAKGAPTGDLLDVPWAVQPSISIVIPAMNEAKNLPHVLPRIPTWVHEVIVVDGRSTDDTVSVARELLPTVRIVEQTGRGKGNALRAGFAAATGDLIVMLDADGSTDPDEIIVYVAGLLAGADFVKGSRFMQGGGTDDMTILRRLGNWGFVTLTKMLFGGQFTDLCYGYISFRREVLSDLCLDADGFEIETLMNLRALRSKLRIAEVPSWEAPRIHGESNLQTWPDGWRVLKTIFREWSSSRKGCSAAAESQRALPKPPVPEYGRNGR